MLVLENIFPLKEIRDNAFYDIHGGKLSIRVDRNLFGFAYSHPTGGGLIHEVGR